MIDLRHLREKFREFYTGEPRVFRAPGRVNLIGEHTDYNNGFVLPMAIDNETTTAIAARNDRKIRVHSVNLDETAEFDLDAETVRKSGFWLNYIEGAARILENLKGNLKGADLLIWSSIPVGAGLSSSAALEISVGLALSKISNKTVDRVTLAKIGQRAEHDFVGANVGIMDQFVSANAEKNHALLLDCRSLEFENIPFDTTEIAVAICDTNVKHDLAASGYNTRRAECEEAVRILQKFLPEIESLRDITRASFEKYAGKMPETIMRRARHIVTENERTLEAAECLKKNDFAGFGKLMYQSHASMRDDYEISCRELDTLVEIARTTDGVLGARMTGGGFGGSTVNLVKRESLANFTEKIQTEYQRQTGLKSTIYISDAAAGASEIILRDAV